MRFILKTFHAKHNLIIIMTFIIIASVSACFLMMNHALLGAFDLPFHFKRIDELALILKHYKLSPIYSFNQFNGSAVMFLYPYFTLVPLSICSLFIKSKIILMYLFFIVNVFLSLIICFYSSLNFSKSSKISYLFAVIYSMSNTFLGYSFFSMDVGLELSYVFLPLVFFGFYDLLQGYSNYYKLSLGVSLLIFSHVLSTVLILNLLLVLFLINIKRINLCFLVKLIKAILISILSTSIVWIHAVIFLYNNSTLIHTPPLIKLSGVSTGEFIKSVLGGLNTFGVGMLPFVGFILGFIFYKRFSIIVKQMYCISVFFIIICTKLFPWSLVPSSIMNKLKYFQFTYRFLIIPILFLSYILSLIIIKFVHIHYIFLLTIIFTCILQFGGQFELINKINKNPSVSNISLNNTKFNESYKITKSSQINKIYNWDFIEYSDYYPKKSMPVRSKIDKNIISGCINHKLYNCGYNKFYFINNKHINHLSLPIVFYKNENIKMYINNKRYKYFVNKNDLLSLRNIKPGKHIIELNNNISVIRNDLLIDGLSWIGIIILIIKYLISLKHKFL